MMMMIIDDDRRSTNRRIAAYDPAAMRERTRDDEWKERESNKESTQQ